MKNAVIITSGGLDSTTALYQAINEHGNNVVALSFDYGQRHVKELQCAKQISYDLGIEHHIIELHDVTKLIATSALTDPDHDVPEGHYEWDTMVQTVVPNRNAMMANIGIAVAVAQEARYMYLGVHAGDHAVYPDCRPEFIAALTQLANIANEGLIHPFFEICTPFIYKTKADIVTSGAVLDVPWEKTWTCYKGGEIHCGRCSTCVERLEAFDLAGHVDTVEYADRDYYKTVIANV